MLTVPCNIEVAANLTKEELITLNKQDQTMSNIQTTYEEVNNNNRDLENQERRLEEEVPATPPSLFMPPSSLKGGHKFSKATRFLGNLHLSIK